MSSTATTFEQTINSSSAQQELSLGYLMNTDVLSRILLSVSRSLYHRQPMEVVRVTQGSLAAMFHGGVEPHEIAERKAYSGTAGFVAVGNGVTAQNLLAAYRRGIHQSSHTMPPKWRVYDQRMISRFENLRCNGKKRKNLRKSGFRFTFDTAFDEVMENCAAPRRGSTSMTWLLPPVMEAFSDLHAMGRAHSLEVWDKNGKLVGGTFGVAYGKIFVGETMFAYASNAGNAAYIKLMEHLEHWGFAFCDGGSSTSEHILSLGGEYVERDEFLDLVDQYGQEKDDICVGKWQIEESLKSF